MKVSSRFLSGLLVVAFAIGFTLRDTSHSSEAAESDPLTWGAIDPAWSPDGKKLAFSATIEGERGLYTVEFPEVGEPKRLASSGLGGARWLGKTKEIVGLSSGGGTGRRGLPPRRVRLLRDVRRTS